MVQIRAVSNSLFFIPVRRNSAPIIFSSNLILCAIKKLDSSIRFEKSVRTSINSAPSLLAISVVIP
jgi:hypothetical protein